MNLIKELKQISSPGTSLITMYIPNNYNLTLISQKLNNELATACNIKDKSVRKNTIYSLKSTINALKSYNHVYASENGLFIASGLMPNNIELLCCS